MLEKNELAYSRKAVSGNLVEVDDAGVGDGV